MRPILSSKTPPWVWKTPIYDIRTTMTFFVSFDCIWIPKRYNQHLPKGESFPSKWVVHFLCFCPWKVTLGLLWIIEQKKILVRVCVYIYIMCLLIFALLHHHYELYVYLVDSRLPWSSSQDKPSVIWFLDFPFKTQNIIFCSENLAVTLLDVVKTLFTWSTGKFHKTRVVDKTFPRSLEFLCLLVHGLNTQMAHEILKKK